MLYPVADAFSSPLPILAGKAVQSCRIVQGLQRLQRSHGSHCGGSFRRLSCFHPAACLEWCPHCAVQFRDTPQISSSTILKALISNRIRDGGLCFPSYTTTIYYYPHWSLCLVLFLVCYFIPQNFLDKFGHWGHTLILTIMPVTSRRLQHRSSSPRYIPIVQIASQFLSGPFIIFVG